MTTATNAGRVLIIGLDGASPHLVQQWQNSLPHLSNLIKGGTSGVLTSVLPPRSIPAWYCFATGMNPAKLGVFGFSQRLPNKYDYTFANLSFCRAPTVWQWLNSYGKKTAVLHLPGSYPPHPVKGVLVSGWPGPNNRGQLIYTQPPHHSREIDALLGQPFEFLSPHTMRLDNDAQMLAERKRILKMHGTVANQLLTKEDWELGIVVFSPVDRASHQFWRHLDPQHPAHDPELTPAFKDGLRQIYETADTEVGRLLSLLNENDTVFIISDHGFGPAYRTFYLNEWLQQQGYLVLKEGAAEQTFSGRSGMIGRLAAPLFWLNNNFATVRRLLAPFKKRPFANRLRDQYVRSRQQGVVRLNHLPVDWQRTRAYCPDEGALTLNLKGRDPQGIVNPGQEAETLLAEIMTGLQNIIDPTTGTAVPVTLHRKEAIYSGPFLAEAPELLVAMDNYSTEVMAEMGGGQLFVTNEARNGTHTMDGLFIAQGPNIPAGVTADANLIDIAPTALHLLDVPIPTETDGDVLRRIFSDEAEMKQRPVQTKAAGLENAAEQMGTELTAEEQAMVEQQLRSLGYLE
jgi:predicted AlkP superfamily phosphohydrolase/phosphomutase